MMLKELNLITILYTVNLTIIYNKVIRNIGICILVFLRERVLGHIVGLRDDFCLCAPGQYWKC